MASHYLRSTSNLFAAGIIAGPLFVVLSLFQAFAREGFDMVRHPASLLSLGDWGWIQIADFVLSGLLFVACAVGLRRGLNSGIGMKWVPRLFVALGVAMIMGGIFVPDPALGFPPGTPDGVPAEMSWHAGVHAFAPILGFMSLIAALFILARRFGSQKQPGWMWVTIIVAVATFVLTSLPNLTADWESGRFNFLPLWGGVALGYGFTSLVLAKLKGEWAAGRRAL